MPIDRRSSLIRAMLFAAAVFAAPAWSAAQEPAQVPAQEPAQQPALRLLDRDPYDEITLNDGTVVPVLPLELKDRRLPEKPKDNDLLIVLLYEEPGKQYEVKWGDIAKITLFEEYLLAEAASLVEQGKYDEAYDYYSYLQINRPTFPGVAAAIDSYLYKEAGVLHAAGKDDYSFARLSELFARNPKYEGLENAMGIATLGLVDARVADQNYRAARGLLRMMAERFPNSPAFAEGRGKLTSLADVLLDKAAAHQSAGRLREAHAAASQALSIWPDHESGRTLLADIHAAYPRIVVGTAFPAGADFTPRIEDWASRRVGRLTERTLAEFEGYGPEGGQYKTPLCAIDKLDLGKRLSIKVSPGIQSASGRPLTGYDVARRLLAIADPADPECVPQWAMVLGGISVNDVYEVEVNLKRAHVRSESLLQTPPAPPRVGATSAVLESGFGPYRLEDRSEAEVRFAANPNYFAFGPTQPREIAERYYADPREAIEALRRGEIAVLERINPWDVRRVAAIPGIKVASYSIPTIHCLLPNLNRPLIAHRTFRRALVYGINREAVLDRQLLRSGRGELDRVLSGPFPRGDNFSDPLGYAYNEEVDPLPYDPRMAMMYTQVALRQIEDAKKAEEEAAAKLAAPAEAQPQPQPETRPAEAGTGVPDAPRPIQKTPELVLGHPPHDLAFVACRAIQRQLEPLGIVTRLEELPPNAGEADFEKCDLVYIEVSIWEPALDAERLLGHDGLVTMCSPYMELSLRQLAGAPDWPTARKSLHRIHELSHEDVSLIPLWQMTDYFAYRESLEGVGDAPVTLYQNVEQWKTAPWFPAD